MPVTNPGRSVTGFTTTKVISTHSYINQRWVVHAFHVGGNEFTVRSAKDERHIRVHWD
jgi:hypothetical protein